MSNKVKVKLLTNGYYGFGEEYVGGVFDAVVDEECGGYTVTLVPYPKGKDKDTWFYTGIEVQVVEKHHDC